MINYFFFDFLNLFMVACASLFVRKFAFNLPPSKIWCLLGPLPDFINLNFTMEKTRNKPLNNFWFTLQQNIDGHGGENE